MEHTEKCGCCINEEAKEIRKQAIDECISAFADWFGYDYENQGYYRLLKQWRDENGK